MPKRIAIGNQKGGVGKTSVVLGLASAASAAEVRTLVVDMDPQGNATTVLGGAGDVTVADILTMERNTAQLSKAIVPSRWPHVALAGTDIRLAVAEEGIDRHTFYHRLRDAMTGAVNQYDLVLIDTMPTPGRLLPTALYAADLALAVTEPVMESSQGLTRFLETIEQVRKDNTDLRLAGVIMNKVPARSREAEFRTEEAKSYLGDQLWEPFLPMRNAMAESRGDGVPIHSYKSRASDLSDVFDQYLQRLMEE